MIIPLDTLVRPPTVVSASTSRTVASRDEAPSAADRPASPVPTTATELRLACLAGTYAGVRIDRDARVIGNDSHPIAGLYAAGECVGGVLGDVYVGSGNALASALVFGRTAGRVAAAAAAKH